MDENSTMISESMVNIKQSLTHLLTYYRNLNIGYI